MKMLKEEIFHLTSLGEIGYGRPLSKWCVSFTFAQVKQDGIVECCNSNGHITARLVFHRGMWKLFKIKRVDAREIEKLLHVRRSLEVLLVSESGLYV